MDKVKHRPVTRWSTPTHRQSVQPRWWANRLARAWMHRHIDQQGGHRYGLRCLDTLRWVDQRGETECVGAWTVNDKGWKRWSAHTNSQWWHTRESPRASVTTQWTYTATKQTSKHWAQGERKLVMNSDNACTSNEADTPGASRHIECTRMRPKKLQNTSELEHECSEQVEEEDPSRSAPDESNGLGDETDIKVTSTASGNVPETFRTGMLMWGMHHIKILGQETLEVS